MYDTVELETCNEGSEQSMYGDNTYGLCGLETCSEASEENKHKKNLGHLLPDLQECLLHGMLVYKGLSVVRGNHGVSQLSTLPWQHGWMYIASNLETRSHI